MAETRHQGKRINGKLDLTATTIAALNGLVPVAYDYIALTYVAAGNGAGEIETVTFKTGGSSGTTVATLTIAYNSSNDITSVTRT